MSKFALKYKSMIFSTFFLASCSTIYKDHGYLPLDTDLKNVVIGNNTHVGSNSIIESNVRIGENCVIGSFVILKKAQDLLK